MALSGAEFKEKYPGPYYKFLRSDLTHRGFTYQLGLNVDTKKFNPEKFQGGFCFFNNLRHIEEFSHDNPDIGVIEIPDDASIYKTGIIFRTDKLILTKIIVEEDELIELFKKTIESHYFLNEDIYERAVENGHFKILEWLKENHCSWEDYMFVHAAQNGRLDVIKWLKENNCPWNEKACIKAAANGNLDIIKWAVENDCGFLSEWVFANAARNGHLEIIKWLKENEFNWDKDTCSYAAENGQLDVLKWVRENDCPWDKDTCERAVANGHLEFLKWAIENGCPWNKDRCLSRAKFFNHSEIIKWITENDSN